jgi:hypothetical protein
MFEVHQPCLQSIAFCPVAAAEISDSGQTARHETANKKKTGQRGIRQRVAHGGNPIHYI